jgi:hypothetical protein
MLTKVKFVTYRHFFTDNKKEKISTVLPILQLQPHQCWPFLPVFVMPTSKESFAFSFV